MGALRTPCILLYLVFIVVFHHEYLQTCEAVQMQRKACLLRRWCSLLKFSSIGNN